MPVRSVEELGADIRQHCRELDWSQQELAECAGVSRQWIVAVEAGKSGAEIGLLLNVLEALDLQMEIVPAPALSLIEARREYDDIDRDIDAMMNAHRRKKRR